MAHDKQHVHSDLIASCDPVWDRLRTEAQAAATRDPAIGGFMMTMILGHSSFEDALMHRLCARLENESIGYRMLLQAFEEALQVAQTSQTSQVSQVSQIGAHARVDIGAVFDRDPACNRFIEPFLYFKGYQAVQTHRFAHALYKAGRIDLAYYLQSRISQEYQVDIHPAVPIGRGFFLDHATGVVVGETAVIADNVSVLQGVTLGGTGKEEGDRHPKIGPGVLIGAGAKVLGNIDVGPCSRIAAGSVVLKPVPPKTTVAGVPAKVIGEAGCAEPSRTMNHIIAHVQNA